MTEYIARYEKNKLGIYIHFPYCVHKCSYCDFYSLGMGKNPTLPQSELFSSYKNEFIKRIQFEPELKDLQVDSLFIGGGTPSMADENLVLDLVQFLKNEIFFAKNFEFTMEANPEDITKEKIENFLNMGVNRLNVGVQSFSKTFLETLDRYYDEEKYIYLLETLSNSKMRRIGIDLIYGIPEQNYEDFLSDLNLALKYRLNHISLYSLTAEKGTEYYRKIISNKAKPPNEELQVFILKELPKILKEKDFSHYEVSNYAKENEYSYHNLKYWKFEKYLSLGPSAHGFTNKGRYFNPKSTEAYIRNEFSFDYEFEKNNLTEFAISVLRLFCKIDLNSFESIFEDKISDIENLVRTWENENLCEYKNQIFQWKEESIFDLDSRILEFSEI